MRLQEKNIAACLNHGMKDNLPPVARQRIVAKTPEWTMLTKPWKSLLLIALNELQIPNDDEDNPTPTPSLMRGRRGSRGRRGGRGAGGPMEWLPEITDVLIDDGSPTAFRLAVLLIRKTLFEEDWEEENDSTIDDLREKASKDGVHPVWQKMAEATPILAQFASFPQAEIIEEERESFDVNAGKIDPRNSKELADAISSFEANCNDATLRVALQKAKAQLNGRRGLRYISGLESLSEDAAIISALLLIHLGEDSSDALKELAKTDRDLADGLGDLIDLRCGKITDWNTSRSLEGEDGLSAARRSAAWAHPPESAAELSSAELEVGLNSISDAHLLETIQMWRLSALVREGASEEALELLNSLAIESDADISTILPLVKSLGDAAFLWLDQQIPRLSEQSLSDLVEDADISIEIRVESARKLHDLGTEVGLESSIDLFTRGLDLSRLADLLLVDTMRAETYPYQTLMVAHLLPAHTTSHSFESLRAARRCALAAVADASIPSAISEISRGLMLMLDGAALTDDKWIVGTLDKAGIKAFNNCRQALRDGGDGLADSKVLDDLTKSVNNAKFSDLEARLFHAVIDTLRLNRASWLLQTGKSKGVVELLDGLLSGEITAMPMMHAVRHLVLEHDLGLENLVAWYQEHDPMSPWHTLARAAIHASNKNELNAARDYRRAGDHGDFDYEHKMMLHRKALIHLAHAEQWSEAVDLLRSEPALQAALTRRFQLYLNVSHSASGQKRTDEGTRLVKNFVRRTHMVSQEGQDGQVEMVEKTKYSEEELDILRNYPNSHPRPLPDEPFAGRVKAAINNLQRERRRNRNAFENRYAQAMLFDPVSCEEVYDIANDAAAEKPLDGLMLLERAQNSGRFNILDIKRLAAAEKGLFANNRHKLAVRDRAYLRNLALSPLVIVDTNILIDELVHRASEKLGISADSALDIGGTGRFHRILLRRAEEGRVHLWLPKVIRNELESIGNDLGRIRSRFGDILVSDSSLDKVITATTMKEIVNDIIKDFSNWSPLDLHIESEVDGEDIRAELKQFLIDHQEVYDEITAMKRIHGEPLRNMIENKDIYPETADQTIMCLAAILAKRPLGELGSILVATRDSDFALVSRALEERFGFGTVANSRNLNTWIR